MARADGLGQKFIYAGGWSDSLLDVAMEKVELLPDATVTFSGYFGGFTPNVAASIMQMQGEPLDPAFNPKWAEGVPNLGIDASVRRASANYTMGPHKIIPMQDEPTIESINEFMDKWHNAYSGGMHKVFVLPDLPEPFSFTPDEISLIDSMDAIDAKGNLIPPSFWEQMVTDIKRGDLALMADLSGFNARKITGIMDVPLCLVGEPCRHDHAWEFPKEPEWKRKLHILLGKLRWARERFARRVYELISEYDFEEEEVDW